MLSRAGKSSEVGVSGEDSNPQTFEFLVPM